MSAFTIKDLENLSGIKAHTIRMWEQRYNFLKPERSCTNIRYYSNDQLKTLLNIALLNKYGFKISHIDRMKPDEIHEKILSLRECEAMQERIVNELVKEMIDLETDKFECCVNRYIQNHGIESAVREIIFPFLEKIGILWQTGHIIPAQEHFVSNIIRQKLIVAIDGLPTNSNGCSCMLYLPNDEYHELGLLFLSYLLKSRGAKIIYLGANVPLDDAASVANTLKPQMAFIHLTSTSPNMQFDKLLRKIHQHMPQLPTFISGYPTCCYHKEVPANIYLKRSYCEVVETVENLEHSPAF
ncbi:MAG: MerR family transcriptional regulator [Chitinophagaceae bacterium]|nr:MerR family transcriptional regulator [Chitinophagaceae bacterium]